MNAVSVNGERRSAGALEAPAVFLGLTALFALLLWITRGSVALTRPLWVDEWFTVLVASHPSPAPVIGDLRAGADGGASLYHLCVWLLYALAGGLSAVALRIMSLVTVIVALTLTYAVLRRSFSVVASLAGVLAVGSQKLIAVHAFDARFYALWLLCCVLYAWSLSSNRFRAANVAVSSALLVASHWYGIITLAIMAAAVFAMSWRDWRGGLRDIAPSAAGLATLLIISPLARGQRAAITVNSWIPDFTVRQIGGVTNQFWFAPVPLLAVAGIVVAAVLILRGRRRSFAMSIDRSVVALLSLAVLPPALVVLSAAGLPSLIGRYSLPAALAWAPLVAIACDLLGRWPARASALALVGFWFTYLKAEVRRDNAFAIGVRHEREVLQRAEEMRLPIVFQSLHTMYPQVAATRGAGQDVMFLDLPDSTLDAAFPRGTPWFQANKGLWLERDFARVQSARFGFPVLAPQAALDTTSRFLFLATTVRLPRGVPDVSSLARAAFPRHRVTPIAEDLLLLERPAASSRSLPARNTSR